MTATLEIFGLAHKLWSTDIAGWTMYPKIEGVFPIEDDMECIPASCVNLPEGTFPRITMELENGSLRLFPLQWGHFPLP